MKKYIYIGMGGFFGASLRFFIKTIPFESLKNFIPINTLIANITGCFLLAFISCLTLKSFRVNPNLKLALCTGFLGAYTTFSTLCKEASYLIYGKYTFEALVYILFSILLGLTSAYLGFVFANVLNKKLNNKEFLDDKSA